MTRRIEFLFYSHQNCLFLRSLNTTIVSFIKMIIFASLTTLSFDSFLKRGIADIVQRYIQMCISLDIIVGIMSKKAFDIIINITYQTIEIDCE